MTEPPTTVGRYHVERLIAHGGMGSLYLARDPAIDRLVVIKLLKDGFDDAEARERFAREARAAGRLHHPNIVTIFDVGEHQDRPFIAMEYVTGETLAQLIRRGGVTRVWEKLAILEELCVGLHYAHGAGIVHRDIKPGNVMRDESGALKILDFGIARAGGTNLTRAGDVVGTLNYMSPEQLVGEQVDHRTDIYSVGALAYELITNHMAYPGTTQTGVLFKILTSSPVPIATLVPGIDPDITALIDRAMAKEPDARYQDLESLRQDLVVVRTRLLETASDIEDATDPDAETRLTSPRVASGAQPRPSSRAGSPLFQSGRSIARRSTSQVIPPPRRAKRVVWLGVACGALLVVALGAAVMLTRLPASRPPVASDTSAQQTHQQTPHRPALSAEAGRQENVERPALEEELSALRVTARQQIVAGQRQPALDTLIRGLSLAATDPELSGLLDELTRVAKRTATEARAAATLRGSSPRSSIAFRDGQTREREADSLLRAGERVPAVRALWAAASLYNKSPEVTTDQAPLAVPAPAPPTRPSVEPVAPPAATTTSPTVLTPPPPEPVKTVPVPADTPAPLPAPPSRERPRAARDPVSEPGDADLSAIRETLRRYTHAYQSLDSAAVGAIMPSLTPDQLRSLARDFANYRSYLVEIRDERIAVDALTATVTCQVVRSFETKNGVAGSNTVESVFHLRRSGSGWTITRLESR